MNKLIQTLMLQINKSIIDQKPLDKEKLIQTISESDINSDQRLAVLRIVEANDNLIALNKKLFDLGDTYYLEQKHKKQMRKFKNKESNDQLTIDYKQYENYIYSLISTSDYKSRPSKTGEKVKLLDIHNIFGHDREQRQKDLIQEGRLYLWEGLKKYGELPEKAKNFGGRMDKGHQRQISSKSTFAHTNLKRNLINLGIKASSDKFKATLVEFKPEILEGPNED